MALRVTLRALHERTPTASEDLAIRRVSEELRPFGKHVVRAQVRLEPAGRARSTDAYCVLEIAIDDGDAIVAEEHGRGAVEAIDRATSTAVALLRARFGEGPRRRGRPAVADKTQGRGSPVGRRGGSVSTASRNTKGKDKAMSYALEDSATGKPSRKSSRKSVNRAKPDSNLRRREMRRARSPKTRAMKGKASGERATK